MDPVTHALIGATTSYVLFGRRLGRTAAAIGALAGITPDVDHFISSEKDPLLYVEFHRQFTHSLLFSIVGSLVATLPWLWRRDLRPRWNTVWLCAWPAYLSHCLLDASTTWGTQLYWPFTNLRAGWDLVAIVDPLFTLTVGIALALGLIRQRTAAAVAGIVFAFMYLGWGGLQKQRAARVQERLAESRGHTRERWEVMPTLGNNIVWRSIYLADGAIHSDRIRVGWFGGTGFREGSSLPQITTQSLQTFEQAANLRTRGFDRFRWFADGWIARSPADPSVLGDMRYSLSSDAFDPVWGIRFVQRNEGVRVEWVSRERSRRPGLAQLGSEIFGNNRFRSVTSSPTIAP